jgi:amino acid adenylation domain-containing protein
MNAINAVGFELSTNQKELWTTSGNMSGYYSQIMVEILGSVDKERLVQSLNAVVERHDILSSRCMASSDSLFPLQTSWKAQNIDFHESMVEGKDIAGIIRQANEFLNLSYDPFVNSPLRLYRASGYGNKSFLFIRLYALWGDTYSCIQLCREIIGEYIGMGASIHDEQVKYQNFSQWQNDLAADPDEEGLKFWDKYQCPAENDGIPFERDSGAAFSPARVSISHLTQGKYTALKDASTRWGRTVEELLLTVFCSYLHIFSDKETAIGYIPFKRSYEELNGTFGLISKVLPVKSGGAGFDRLGDAADYISRIMEEVISWGDYFRPVHEGPGRLLLPYCFEYVQLDRNTVTGADGVSFSTGDIYSVTNPFSVKLFCVDDGDSLSIDLYYDTYKFTPPAVDVMTAQLKHRCEMDVDTLFDMPVVSDKDNAVFIAAHSTVNRIDTGITVLQLIETQSMQAQNAIAVIDEEGELSYGQLNELSNELAWRLIQHHGVLPGDRVGVLLHRSGWMVIGLLAAMKAGAAYVPIDPVYPEERIAFILEDCQAKLLISEKRLIGGYIDRLATLDITDREKYIQSLTGPVDTVVNPGDIAYVMYTSGSTGHPKGCQITHANLSNYLQWANEYYFSGTEYGNCGLITSFSFDLTVTCLYIPLIRGKKLYIGGKDKDMSLLLEECFNDPDIDTVKLTPSHLTMLKTLDIKSSGIRILICGGEQLTKDQVNIVRQISDGIRIFNEYGPTETTVGAVVKEITREDEKITIGQPIANTEVVLLDGKNNRVPIWAQGEICIGGAGLSPGYWHRPELTGEKFAEHPYKKTEKIYRTGDLGRWLPDGNIEYLGRRDDQVKIRGYRIEPGEIENALLAFQDIDAAAVIAKPDEDGQMELVACIAGAVKADISAIRTHLEAALPSYMVPGKWVLLERLPLTPNGKIDRKKLSGLDGQGMQGPTPYIPPGNAMEELLVSIWQDVLGKDRVGIRDSFFDLGGHSLKATRLVAQIHKVFNVKIQLRELFARPVLEDQARMIGEAKRSSFSSIQAAPVSPDYPLSSSQLRVWVLSQFEEGRCAYNMPGLYVFEGDLVIDALTIAFEKVITRHEALRTVFSDGENGTVRQIVLSPEELGFRIGYLDLRREPDPEALTRDLIQNDFTRPFDLAAGPLIRACLYQTADLKWTLSYTLHHIIGDGWSMNILLSELMQVYNAYVSGTPDSLKPLSIQYKDYAVWQQGQLAAETMQIHRDYWLKQFEGNLPVLDLPGDAPRPLAKTYNGGRIYSRLGADLTGKIKKLSHDQGATLFMGLTAAVNILLHKYTHQTDIIVGGVVSGREHADLQDQIGFYTNTLALRTTVDPSNSFTEVIRSVKHATFAAYEHEAYPFDELVNALNLKPAPGRNPLFDVLIEYRDTNMERGRTVDELTNIKASTYESDRNILSKFDLTFFFTLTATGLNVIIEYNRDIFSRDTLQRWSRHLEILSEMATARPDIPVSQLELLDGGERMTILADLSPGEIAPSQYRTVLQLLEEQVRQAPSSPALIFEDQTVSYQELNERANSLARHLMDRYHVQKEDAVGVMIDRSTHMIIAVLAILKAGGTYVPIDPAYPKNRKKHIVQDAGLKLLITQTDYIYDLDYYQGDVFAIDIQLQLIPAADAAPDVTIAPTDRAYIIYTSGSTGLPKGCEITHGNLLNYIQWANGYYFRMPGRANFGLYTSLSFDLTVTSLFCPLTQGGKLVIYPSGKEIQEILRHSFSAASGINCIKLTPSHINILASLDIRSDSMLCVITGGESVSESQVRTLKDINPAIAIYNEYGPTETTVGCIVRQLEVDKKVLIGKPISNTSIHILDETMNICPIGIYGEIYISGESVGRGYFRKEELTAQRFMDDPFRQGSRMYRTGDIGRWLADGNIEFTGRHDDQVKIDGYRVETGEIMNTLLRHDAVRSVFVMAREDAGGHKYLVGYFVAKGDYTQDAALADIKTYLKEHLPAYMVPGVIIQLEDLPLTTNGKVDKDNLPDPAAIRYERRQEYIAPRNETEEKLVAVWQELLGKERVGVTDNFFELGGHSIKAIRLIAMVSKQFNVDYSLDRLFGYPTIEDMAEEIDKANWANIDEAETDNIDNTEKFLV